MCALPTRRRYSRANARVHPPHCITFLPTYSSLLRIYSKVHPPRPLHRCFHVRQIKFIIRITIMRAVAILAILLGCASVAFASVTSDGRSGSGVMSGCQSGELTCTYDETAVQICQAGAWAVKDVCKRGYSCSPAALVCRRRPFDSRGELESQGVDTTSTATNIKDKVEKSQANASIY